MRLWKVAPSDVISNDTSESPRRKGNGCLHERVESASSLLIKVRREGDFFAGE
jgi:hypothetical protein